ncbi:hypothetical protein METBIDRAFT_77981 [Metschnikowia bicuspidata var. bicuspidata NRRL YB-4993]|uniref:Glucose starvation modulator protein 1 n=1 Tax=Metschnikowia bicuspidata var. bicuspidata NRRL YB-4993 TaxID=869754 RepID=A0A1A0HFJ4_9ASCO|nr:hypothetical protein METBIDRAFT_77981 [Metschnikowia bicuspidata var. bicuspidata NRRL YB-4993]OBA22633.1 hypothetical protein METBIDRAFT_77981 [Metschnikowia bicuspidata var. bicuspidata NRRL YB-4993]
MTRKLTPGEKVGRKPTLRACTFCHLKHLQCLNTRPCQNCVKRKIEHGCKDIVRKRALYLLPGRELKISRKNSAAASEHRSSSSASSSLETPGSTPSTTANFHSMFLNQEYMMLGDLILKPLLPSPAFAPVPGQLVTPEFFDGLDGMGDGAESRPYISLGDGAGKLARENGFNFDLRASDDQEYVLPLLSHHIYQTVQDIYSNRIINFDYPLSYHSLTFFLKNRFSVASKHATPEVRARKRHNLLVILKLIASYRPTFISAHKSLFQPFDFQFLEMLFQRCLLDFENLSRLNASPMIIWRRTGEIVLMLAHLADILGLNISDVLSKRTFIIELMYDDESIVEYFRLFKSVAIGSLHLTIFTKCKLIKRPSDHRMSTSKTNAQLTDVAFIEFCSVWTVKRDLFDLPMMIVGHFLPSLPNSDAVRSY